MAKASKSSSTAVGRNKQSPDDSSMEFDGFHVRRYFLAGTVGFPTPFPSVGEITRSKLLPPDVGITWADTPWSGEQHKDAVVIHQPADSRHSIYRVVLLDDVQAIFAPDDDNGGASDCMESNTRIDLDQGDWILKPDVNRELPKYGIVFVKETAPVFRRAECIELAIESAEHPLLVDCTWGCSCT